MNNYRAGIGIYLFNNSGKVFAAKRIDNTSEAWQMPQGGIDDGETPTQALFRELMEEVGLDESKVELVKEIPQWLHYDLPEHLQKILWKGQYKGQKQKWFALKFLGNDADINIATHTPEFNEWKWVEPQELQHMIVDFKKDLYAEILKEFI